VSYRSSQRSFVLPKAPPLTGSTSDKGYNTIMAILVSFFGNMSPRPATPDRRRPPRQADSRSGRPCSAAEWVSIPRSARPFVDNGLSRFHCRGSYGRFEAPISPLLPSCEMSLSRLRCIRTLLGEVVLAWLSGPFGSSRSAGRPLIAKRNLSCPFSVLTFQLLQLQERPLSNSPY
jgi:hypothetical protein